MKNNVYAFFLGLIGIGSLAACNTPGKPSIQEKIFLDPTAMDSSVRPPDNFYLYVNGEWIKKVQIPPTESSLGSFLNLFNSTNKDLHSILDDISRGNQVAGSSKQKAGDFYASGMDSAAIEKLGFDPLKPYFQQIENVKGAGDIMRYVTGQHTQSNDVLFTMTITPDEKNSSVNIAAFGQGGLGLPDRDYYFKTDEATKDVVKSYQYYIQKLFRLIGNDSVTAAKKMWLVYGFEKKLAFSHRTNVQLRDPQSNYNKKRVADLDKKMPFFAWKTSLGAMKIHADSVDLGQPPFYIKVNELLASAPLDTWKDYLLFHTINDYANVLSSPFVNAKFNYEKTLSGQQELKPRWERMVGTTDELLGDALGQVYVKKFFTEDAKKRMQELVNNLQTAFEARVNKLDWMSDSTKTKSKEKLHAFLKQVGYPDKWRDYSKVTIDRNTYFANLISILENQYQYQLNKIGKPVDRTEWDMTPPTINAGYYPTFNKIVFPAGILQFPFFDLNADDAINYGGIGMFIGHEMTHGFDDQGAQYDKYGNIENWWAKDDSIKFVSRSKKVIDLYNSFTVLDTVHVNGALTNGENIADIGGIAIAYDAFKMTKQGQDSIKIDGFTPDQRFFLSFAQAWRSKAKDETVRTLINRDPHSPDMWRVLGPLMNFAPFYAAFNVQHGDKMYRADSSRIKIW